MYYYIGRTKELYQKEVRGKGRFCYNMRMKPDRSGCTAADGRISANGEPSQKPFLKRTILSV